VSDSPESQARNQLNAQVEAFLSKGGEIQEIPVGETAWNQNAQKSQWARQQVKGKEKPE